MLTNSSSKNALVSAVLTLAACSLPQRRQEELDANCLHTANLGISQGVSELYSKTDKIGLEVTKGSLNQISFNLPRDLKKDGQAVLVDGVAHSISFINPSFLKSESAPTLYRDTFGNAIQVSQLGNPGFNPVPKVMVNFPIKTSATGELCSFDFDLRPIGGPLVTDLVIGKTLTPTSYDRLISDVDSNLVQQRFNKSLPALIKGTKEVEQLWSSNGEEFVENIVLIDHPAIFAGCNEGSPFKFMLSTGCLNNLQSRDLDTAFLARHESLHILDRHLGYPSDSEEFKGLFEKITLSDPDFFEAINEKTVFQNKHMGGHSADNPKELFASFINMAIHYDKTGLPIPSSIKKTAQEVSKTLISILEKLPNGSVDGKELIRVLKTIDNGRS
jgi:hypothetical protein